ncbi:MAG: collagenase [Clostridium sp.]|nr:collagenase [Clostridium sp.]
MKLSKKIISLLLSLFLAGNCSGLVMANDNKKNNIDSSAEEVMLPYEPNFLIDSEEVDRNPNIVEAKDINDFKNNVIAPYEEKLNVKTTLAQRQYTLSELSDLSYSDMVNVIVKLQWYEIDGLFTYSDEAQRFFGDFNRVKYIINELNVRAKSFTSSDDKGIPTLVEVLRAGYYLGYYNEQLSYLNTQESKNLCLPALESMISNQNFKFGNSTENGVINSFGALIGNTSCNIKLSNKASLLMKEYRENIDEYNKDRSKGQAIHSVISGVSYAFSSMAYNKNPKEMFFYGKIDEYINELKNISLMTNEAEENQWFINNGIYYLGDLGLFHSNSTMANSILTSIMDTAIKYSERFYVAAQRIVYKYNGVNSRGEKIDYGKLQEEGNKKYLPKEYSFDDGSIVMHVGDKVSEEKVKKLYWAAKEVEAQFFRVIGEDDPIDKTGYDDVLTIKIFNSPKEYDMNRYLSGLSTDNGGIYIESTGTFYTYERTEQESIYSLEELFRHEFTHYLQGRYLVPGLWGDGEFYKNDDLVWYEEGSAEFFAGATRTDGVEPRISIVDQLSDNKSEMYDLNRLFSSNYNSGWEFYNYGFAFVSYLYNNDMRTFNEINNSIMNNDINGYRSILNNSKYGSANDSYKNYIKNLVGNKDKISTPLVSDDYIINHEELSINTIVSDVSKIGNIKNVTSHIRNSSEFKLFEVEGEYEGNESKGKLQDYLEMSDVADKMLKNLSDLEWTGYDTVTCYFTDYKVVDGKYNYNLVFRGLLKGEFTPDLNKAPIAFIEGPLKGKVNDIIKFSADKSFDEDGQINEYRWDFGDGTTSNEKNPMHIYSEQGAYTVKLTVIDDKGGEGIAKFSITIDKKDTPENDGAIVLEKEPNNTFDEANRYIGNNINVEGILDNTTDTDIFQFEVEKAGEVDISFISDIYGTAFIVYKEDDLNNMLCWAQYEEEDSKTGKFDAVPGKYYLLVYGYDDYMNNCRYAINIKGIKDYSDFMLE